MAGDIIEYATPCLLDADAADVDFRVSAVRCRFDFARHMLRLPRVVAGVYAIARHATPRWRRARTRLKACGARVRCCA